MYNITVESISNNVDLHVYNDGTFTNLAGSSTNAGTTNEAVNGITAASSLLTVQIEEKVDKGATFVLKVIKQ